MRMLLIAAGLSALAGCQDTTAKICAASETASLAADLAPMVAKVSTKTETQIKSGAAALGNLCDVLQAQRKDIAT